MSNPEKESPQSFHRTPEQAEKEKRLENVWLAALRSEPKWKGPVLCPVCKTGNWQTLSAIELPLRYQQGRVHVAIPVRCTNCGNMLLFHAKTLPGVLNEHGDPVEPEQLVIPEADPPKSEDDPNAESAGGDGDGKAATP